ncbi:MAG TPA: hypothetical protein VK619_00090 [Pyrinomonadaceae bacterium]|nr:hypothetical protein [Pyrinomonadaceae bacterium]
MKEKMTLIILKETGHVLAATTRAAMADEPTDKKVKQQQDAQDLKALAGDELLVRFGGDPTNAANIKLTEAEFPVPMEELDLLSGEFDASVLQDARIFCLDNNQVPQPAAPPATVALSQTEVTVTVSPVQVETKVWVQVQDDTGSDIQIVRGAIEPIAGNNTEAKLNLRNLSNGTYLVLAYAVGYQPITLLKLLP